MLAANKDLEFILPPDYRFMSAESPISLNDSPCLHLLSAVCHDSMTCLPQSDMCRQAILRIDAVSKLTDNVSPRPWLFSYK